MKLSYSGVLLAATSVSAGSPPSAPDAPKSDRTQPKTQAPKRPWLSLFFGREPLIYRILIWAERNRWKD